jgi:hypothetical protein
MLHKFGKYKIVSAYRNARGDMIFAADCTYARAAFRRSSCSAEVATMSATELLDHERSQAQVIAAHKYQAD